MIKRGKFEMRIIPKSTMVLNNAPPVNMAVCNETNHLLQITITQDTLYISVSEGDNE